MKTTRHEKFIRAIIILCGLVCLFSAICRGQDRKRVILEGNNFTEERTTRAKDSTATAYTFTDSKGNKYPIFLSKSGKAYIPRTSAKSGKYYRQYKPEITEAIKNQNK